MTGNIAAIFVDSAGNAGLLADNNLSGDRFPDLGMWKTQGTLKTNRILTGIDIATVEVNTTDSMVGLPATPLLAEQVLSQLRYGPVAVFRRE